MSKQDSNWQPIGIRWGLIGDAYYFVSPRTAQPELSRYMTEKPPADEVFEEPPPPAVIPQVPSSLPEMPPPLPVEAPKKRVRMRR